MHANPQFRFSADQARLGETAFATLTASGLGRPAIAHAPVWLDRVEGRLQFHLARNNALVPALRSGGLALACVLVAEAYVSPDWYENRDAVPTWNYVAAEFSGPTQEMTREGLVQLLDRLSAAEEEGLRPKKPWTREKMSSGRFEAMLGAILGFEMKVERAEATLKLSQNKSAADRAGVLRGLRQRGRAQDVALADWMVEGVGT